MFRRWKNRLPCSSKSTSHQFYLSIENELKNVHSKLEKLSNENNLLKNRCDKLEERYERWINDEQIYLTQRIEKLENENHQLYKTYQTHEMKNQNSIQSITNLMIKILMHQKEFHKQYIQRYDVTPSSKKEHENQLFTRSKSCTPCHAFSNQLDDGQYTTNDESVWPHQRLMIVEDQDQKTTNQSSGLNKHSSTLATLRSKPNKSSTNSTNKVLLSLKNAKSTKDDRPSANINIVSINDSPLTNSNQQQSSAVRMTLNRNRSSQQSSNHQRLSTQSSSTTTTTTTKTIPTSISKPSRIPTTKPRPPVTAQKTVRPRISPVKAPDSIRNTIIRPPLKPTTTTNKTPMTTVVKQRARATDLDALMAAEQQQQQNKTQSKLIDRLPTVVITSPMINNVRKSLFTKDTVKRVQPVRSHELKLFSNHLTSDICVQSDESSLTLTPCSLESIKDSKSNENHIEENNNQNQTINVIRDISEDSLDEHDHIQKIIRTNLSTNDDRQTHSPINTNSTSTADTIEFHKPVDHKTIKDGYFLSVNNNSKSDQIHSSIDLPSEKPCIHRLIFPKRLGRTIFFRRILSDTDIYQKNCSKDNEISHNVYHLDSIRDFSMEFYMLTTYTSDSQLIAWAYEDDDVVVNTVCHRNDDCSQQNENHVNENQIIINHSRDSLNREDEEMVWCSELEIENLSLSNPQEKHDNASINSSEAQTNELIGDEQFSMSSLTTITSDSSSLTSPSSILSNDASIRSTTTDHDDAILHEILHNTYSFSSLPSNAIEQQIHDDEYKTDDSASSIVSDEFQSDFYYLCPITNTTNFSKTDYKSIYHDI